MFTPQPIRAAKSVARWASKRRNRSAHAHVLNIPRGRTHHGARPLLFKIQTHLSFTRNVSWQSVHLAWMASNATLRLATSFTVPLTSAIVLLSGGTLASKSALLCHIFCDAPKLAPATSSFGLGVKTAGILVTCASRSVIAAVTAA